MADPAPPFAGILADGEHVLTLRVYYEDTDAAGIVYYANYLRFAERGRTEMMRLLGIDQSAMRAASSCVFAVRECNALYLQPARLDDVVEVRTRLIEVRGASLQARQTVMRGTEELVRLDVCIVCLDARLRPVRVPASVRTTLARLVRPSSFGRSAAATDTNANRTMEVRGRWEATS
ncbi:MAG: tol-pal system-associated acyl-CoA thioesterase [Alphaproteobacteria bacterium]|nr:tol-pal system-associated acyl-CoA thioesterase [Alphaproteobacteria bacterium]